MNTKVLPPCRLFRYYLPPLPQGDIARRRFIRGLHPETTRSLIRLHEELELYPIGYSPYSELCLLEGRHMFWTAEWNNRTHRVGRVIGMMFCTPLHLMGQRFGVIHDTAVLREFQSRGIASELLDAVIAWTREESHMNGIPPILSLQTSVARELKSATHFFHIKHGFRRITEDDCPYYERDIRPGEYCPDSI